MKNFLILFVVGAAVYFGYSYLAKSDHPITKLLALPESLPTRDAQGREVVPCQRCLATGEVTCQASRCKGGQIPCPGRCLKLSDSGWQRMDGQDPNKLFMIYRFNGRSVGVSQDHIGEVFEVRLGKFYNLGVCHTCAKRTTVVCTVCDGTGKVVCPTCKGSKVVLKTSGVASPVPKG